MVVVVGGKKRPEFRRPLKDSLGDGVEDEDIGTRNGTIYPEERDASESLDERLRGGWAPSKEERRVDGCHFLPFLPLLTLSTANALSMFFDYPVSFPPSQ